MEQSSFSNVILTNSSNSFINGGQQVTSGSSSSTGSSNGTPSHSYKGSFTPSSPSSDECSASLETNNRSLKQLPVSASDSPLILTNVGNSKLNPNSMTEPSVPSKYIAQNPSFSQPALFNQNVFTSPIHNKSHFDNMGDINTPFVSKDSLSKVSDNVRSGFSENQFPKFSPELPDSRPQKPNISSFFNNSNQVIESSLPTTTHAVSGKLVSSATSTLPSNSLSANKSQTSYSAHTVTSKPNFNNLPDSMREQTASIISQPTSYPRQNNQATSFSQLSRQTPSSVGSETMNVDHRSFPTSTPSYNIPQSSALPAQSSALPTQSYVQTQVVPPQLTQAQNTKSAYPTYPSTVPKSSVSSLPANPPIPAYQNISLGQSIPPMQPTFVNRSHVQSPLANRQSVNSNNPQLMPSGNKQFSTSRPGLSNYPPPSQNHDQFSQPSLTNNPHIGANRMYEMNGHQPAPVTHQGYVPQYSSVPPQMANRYMGVSGNDVQAVDGMARQFSGMSVTKQGFYGARGIESCDLLRMRDILPKRKIEPPSIHLPPELPADCNCDPDVIRCTITKIPESKALLDKSRLPLGILLHPFRDLTNLSVIQCSTIVRCRSCRTYINPFVYFIDNRHWKCNLCFRTNDLPDDFRYNPSTKMHDDPLRRPEVKNATIEFIASSEYMVRPPQPAIYLFILDVSRIATQTGYLSSVCEVLSANLGKLPGDSRTSVGFITVDSAIRFYDLGENLNQPHELIVTDVDDIFIPFPENLIVNLHEQFELIKDLLEQIPEKFKESYDTNCALGAALQAAHKIMAPTGGRVTVFVSSLPNYGPGALTPREDVAQRSNNNINLNPVTDFYKKIALECINIQVAVDLFVVNAQFVDLATISGVCQISGGCMHHFPLFNNSNVKDVDKFARTFERYLTRKIGFEAVMRLRCTKNLSIHSFHGNFFVRSVDLMTLPIINPDSGFGMQVSIDDNLSDLQSIGFQAALLYTSSKGERRIRVHTLCLPVVNNLQDVLLSADQQCIAGLLAKMGLKHLAFFGPPLGYKLPLSATDTKVTFLTPLGDKPLLGNGYGGVFLLYKCMQRAWLTRPVGCWWF